MKADGGTPPSTYGLAKICPWRTCRCTGLDASNRSTAHPRVSVSAPPPGSAVLQAGNADGNVPPGLLHRGARRPEPFLYAEADIVDLMAAARRLRSPLRAATIETLIGLLAATGLRVGEVIRLDRGDLDLERDVLSIRTSKLGRSRQVPLHASTAAALRAYLLRRDELLTRASSPALFISTTGTRLRAGNLRTVFLELVEHAGLPARRGQRGHRIADLRHSFAVQTLLDWHLTDVDVGPRLPVLSTYLGHVSPASTYWYLSASPPLLAAAARRLDHAGRVLP
jgi:integrase/recombinase XerD